MELNHDFLQEKKIVITIAREYGSGGLTIGRMLAEKLGINYYDKDLIKIASEESGINEGLFGKSDEKLKKNGIISRVFEGGVAGKLKGPESDDYTRQDNIFLLQAETIKALAERESCIIIGRCGDYILRDYPNVLSVFVHAPEDYCLEQAAKKHSLNERELKKLIQKIDKDRSDYYHYYTGRAWTDARNYSLCLDSSKLGFDRCVDEIIGYLQIRFK